MKNLILICLLFGISNSTIITCQDDTDIFYELVLNEIPEKLFINNKVTFQSYAKWRTQLDDICGSGSKFLNDNECEILKRKFIDQEKDLMISDDMKNKMNSIAEKLYVNNSKEKKVSYLLSNPVFINDEKVVIMNAIFFEKGGGQSAYIFIKENGEWIINKHQALVDY